VAQRVLAGMGAAAGGLILATAVRLASAQRARWRWLGFGVIAFLAVGVLRVSLVTVLPVLGTLAVTFEGRPLRRINELACVGNEILAKTNAEAKAAGLIPTTYTHPLGFFGHASGPTIGMWDNQGPTPVRGDWKLHPMTGYAIEGNVKVNVPEWDGQWVQVKLEQGALFDGKRVTYLAGRQVEWHVIK
jgi:hypothetical protein